MSVSNNGSAWDVENLFQPQPADIFHLGGGVPPSSAFPLDGFDPDDLNMGLFSPPPVFTGDYAAQAEDMPRTFRFMARFTQFSGLVDSFECGSLSERQQLVGRSLLAMSTAMPTVPVEDGTSWDLGPFDLSWTGDMSTAVDYYALPGVLDLPIRAPCSGRRTDMGNCTASIVSMLKDVTLNKPRRSKINITWSPAVEASCYRFFSAPILERNLELFWSCWHPNCPILHKPTFSAARSSPVLVASMAVMGACLSPSHSDRAHANLWFNSLEELAFQEEILLDDTVSVSNGTACGDDSVHRRLEAIQAAYFVCLVQYWEGSKPSKRRIRSHRYAAMLAVSFPFYATCGKAAMSPDY